jgi:hypothetical protein
VINAEAPGTVIQKWLVSGKGTLTFFTTATFLTLHKNLYKSKKSVVSLTKQKTDLRKKGKKLSSSDNRTKELVPGRK